MGNGFVKLHRNINNNELLANDNNSYVVFTRLLTLVNRHTGSYTTGRKKLAVFMNLKESTLYDVLKRLERATIIRLESNRYSTTIHICNWWDYQQDTNSKPTKTRSQTGTKQEGEGEGEVTTNVVKAKTPSADIDEMFLFWESTTGISINGQKTKNRYACSNLLKKYGKETLQALIRAVAATQGVQYAPSISDFSGLQAKQNDLALWIKKQGTSGKVVKI